MNSTSLKRLVDVKLLKFVGVGVANTLLGLVLMFGLYRLAGFGYWWSSAISYFLGSVFSFFANKSFTFQDRGKIMVTALRFAITAAVCYLFAFSVAKPLVGHLLAGGNHASSTVDQVAMLCGMVIYTAANYVLQRFFVFRNQRDTRPATTPDALLDSADLRD